MKKLFLRSALAVATAAALTLTMAPAAQAATAKPSNSTVVNYILAKSNEARTQAKLRPLVLNSSLNTIAQACSVKQAKNAQMAHCLDYYKKYPAGWRSAAENVAYGYNYKQVVDAWLKSPGHRKNLLSASTDIGIGVAYDSRGLPYYTQDFAQFATFKGTAKLSGTPKVNTTLTAATAGYPSGTSFAYTWYADGKAIAGQHGKTIKFSKAYVGKNVKAKVITKKAGYSTDTKVTGQVKLRA
jgi:hypothetical protein